MITACPKCLLENLPSGRLEELLYVAGAVQCAYHGEIQFADLSPLFETAKSEGRFLPNPDQSSCRNFGKDKSDKSPSVVLTEEGLLAAEQYLRDHSEEFDDGTKLGAHKRLIRNMVVAALRASHIDVQTPSNYQQYK